MPRAGSGQPGGATSEPTPAEVYAYIAERNPVIRHLEVELVSAAPGAARLAMRVRDDMVNVHRTLHGGLLFTFADIVIGLAAQGRNERAVSADAQIQFLSPGKVGDRLIGEGVEIWRKDRTGVYDVRVWTEGGETLALIRGRMRFLGEPHIV